MSVEFDWLGRICELSNTIERAMRAEIPGVDEVVAKNEGRNGRAGVWRTSKDLSGLTLILAMLRCVKEKEMANVRCPTSGHEPIFEVREAIQALSVSSSSRCV